MNPINSLYNQLYSGGICSLWKLVLKLMMLKAERVCSGDYSPYQLLMQFADYELLKAGAQPDLLAELLRRELYGFQSYLSKRYRS